MRVGSLVKYSDSYKDTTGIITEVQVRGNHVIAEVYWSSDKVIWEYVDELEVIE
tara:strand:- start:424 stop:585 length:162 start_codon:yes stop_codon:yes gene_type:complete